MWDQKICTEIFNKKYMINNGDNSVNDVLKGIAKEISSNEKDAVKWEEIFYNELSSYRLIPAGRIVANARPDSQNKYYNNCYTIDIDDSIDKIYESLKYDALISATGGGVGFNISKLRPNGSITSKGGVSSGPISFLKVFNESAKIIQTGGFRRAAHIAILNVDHPDIEEFITCKQGENNNALTQFNISVGITNKFMEAVEKDLDWNLLFDGVIYKTIKARYLYNLIMKNAYKHNEPGLFFLDRVEEDNNAPHSFTIDRCNPCFTGETLVAVADGRNAVPIKILAEESKGEKKFPVYSGVEKKTQRKFSSFKAEIKDAVAFKTGKREVIKVVLSDGTFLRCTPEHLLATKDGRWVEAQNSKGEQLEKFYSFSNKNNNKNYRTINSMTNGYAKQYRMIYEFYNGEYDGNIMTIDHKDENAFNDKIENLILLPKKVHNEKTRQNRLGKNNPIHRMNKEYRRWIQKKRNINANATRYNWTEEKCKEAMDCFLKNNPKPIFKSKNIDLSYRIFVKDIVWTGDIEDVYDLTVKDNNNFYIITNGDNNYGNSCGVLVHNCGEISMPSWSLCCLSSINFTKFVINPFEENCYFDYDQLEKTIIIGIRFLDNVLDVTKYPLPIIEEFSKKWRRIGLGFTGFADALAMMRIPYNSDKAKKFTNQLAEFFRNSSYNASINLAIEKGSYPEFRFNEIKDSGFFNKLPSSIQDRIKDFGLRNVGINTIAPNGTISLTLGQNCSSGIEPIFSLEYNRKIRTDKADTFIEEKVYDYAWLLYKNKLIKNEDEKNIPNFFVTTFDIDPYQAIDIQAIWQNYIDHSISKTINLPNGFSFEQYKNLYQYAYEKGLKGVTTFNPEGSIKGILSSNSKKDTAIIENHAIKRPELIPCDIHEIVVDKQKHIVLCGFLDGYMFEIFVTPNIDSKLDLQKYKKGFVKKIKSGVYDLIVKNGEEKIIISNIGQSFDSIYGSLSRFISMSLRHHIPLQFIVDQLQKDSNFVSFERAVSRVLKKYIKDGQISTHKCLECGGDLEYQEGCLICKNCGYSKCD